MTTCPFRALLRAVLSKKLTKDLADEVFCQNLTSMLALGFEVAKLNFGWNVTQLAEKARNNAAEKETA